MRAAEPKTKGDQAMNRDDLIEKYLGTFTVTEFDTTEEIEEYFSAPNLTAMFGGFDADEVELAKQAVITHMLKHFPERLAYLGLVRTDEIDGNIAAIFDDGSIIEYSDDSDCWVLSEKRAWISTLKKFEHERPFYAEHADEVALYGGDPEAMDIIDTLASEGGSLLYDEIQEQFAASLRPAIWSVAGWTHLTNRTERV